MFTRWTYIYDSTANRHIIVVDWQRDTDSRQRDLRRVLQRCLQRGCDVLPSIATSSHDDLAKRRLTSKGADTCK